MQLPETKSISDVIAALGAIRTEKGDLPVFVSGHSFEFGSTGWNTLDSIELSSSGTEVLISGIDFV